MKIAKDKWKHFYVGIAMGLVLQGILYFLLPVHFITGTLIVFLIIVGISYGLELYSKFTGKGHYEIFDAVAAVLGGMIGMALILCFYLF